MNWLKLLKAISIVVGMFTVAGVVLALTKMLPIVTLCTLVFGFFVAIIYKTL